MFTRHNVMLVIIAALAAVIGIVGVAHGGPSDPIIGYPLPIGCQANVAINTAYGMPGAAIRKILDNNGHVMIDGVGPDDNRSLTIQMTITGWTLYEDSELWGDLRDYEVEGTCLPQPTNHTTFMPIITR